MPKRKPPADVTDLEQWRATRKPRSEKPRRQAPPAGNGPAWAETLRILVFATDHPERSEASAPFVIIPEAAAAFLPQHPDGREWRYFATMRLDDQMLASDRTDIASALHDPGYYISHHPLNG
jgi:hypothetical protein